MKRIFDGEVYEVVPQPNGIVFSYCKSVVGEQVLVAYKMISLDTGRMTDVAKNIYQLSKFGSCYRSVAGLCGNYVTARAVLLPSSRVFVCSDDGTAMLFDGDGEEVWRGELKYRGAAPADIALYKNSLWACYSESGVLLRFNLATMREELRIGGADSPFVRPSDIFIDGSDAVISSSASNRLLRVDLNAYTVESFKEFTEPVYGYCRVKNYDFTLMKSGLYVL